MSRIGVVIVAAALVAAPALAIHPGTEVFVSAAARGAGVPPSVWVTDLYVYNPNDTAANVTIYWLVRGQANASPASTALTVGAAQTAVLEDIIKNRFALDSGNGAFRVVSDVPVMVNAAIINKAGGTEFGQGFEGIPGGAAIQAGSTTNVIALKNNAAFRTNLILIDTTGSGSNATVQLVDPSGAQLAQKSYTLGAYQPVLESMSAFGAPTFQDGTLVVTVTAGAVLACASRINQSSGDPLTLSAWWPLQPGGGGGLSTAGTYYGTVALGDFTMGISLTIADTAAAAAQAPDTRVLQSYSFNFYPTNSNCAFVFTDGGTFDPPVALSDILNGGVYWSSSYGTGYGNITWTLALTESSPNLNFQGTLSATGDSWPQTYVGCNADLGTGNVNLGKSQ